MNSYQDEDNASRVARADKIINLAHSLQGGDYQDALCDLLTDLMHWSKNTGTNFRKVLKLAKVHFDVESVQPYE